MQQERVFVVLAAIAVVVVLARWLGGRLRIPDAIILVVLGLAIGFIPWMPSVQVSPEVVLYGFLPPLVFHAAFFSAPREARADAVPIVGLAFGLTAATTAAVALVVHLIFPQVGWAAAVAFGAAIAPTDAVAATSVLQRLGAPQRLVTILEGESLINDGIALTIFGLAVEGLAGPFTVGHGALRSLQVVAGGVAFGLLVGIAVRRLRRPRPGGAGLAPPSGDRAERAARRDHAGDGALAAGHAGRPARQAGRALPQGPRRRRHDAQDRPGAGLPGPEDPAGPGPLTAPAAVSRRREGRRPPGRRSPHA